MKTKRISLRGISEVLSEKELKNVMGGSDSSGGGSCCDISCTDGYSVLLWSDCSPAYLLCYGGVSSVANAPCPNEYYDYLNCLFATGRPFGAPCP